jgi:hypothetical protein
MLQLRDHALGAVVASGAHCMYLAMSSVSNPLTSRSCCFVWFRSVTFLCSVWPRARRPLIVPRVRSRAQSYYGNAARDSPRMVVTYRWPPRLGHHHGQSTDPRGISVLGSLVRHCCMRIAPRVMRFLAPIATFPSCGVQRVGSRKTARAQSLAARRATQLTGLGIGKAARLLAPAQGTDLRPRGEMRRRRYR